MKSLQAIFASGSTLCHFPDKCVHATSALQFRKALPILTQESRLTFDPKVGGAADALGANEVPGGGAGVVGVVDDAVEPPARPVRDVPLEARGDRLEVVLGHVGRHAVAGDGVAVVVVGDGRAVLEPEDVAQRRALHLALHGELGGLGHGARVGRQPLDEGGRRCKRG